MSDYGGQTRTETEETFKMWSGTCRIENGVLHISEKRYRKLKSSWFFLLMLSTFSLSYAAYLHYTDAETVFYDSMRGYVHAPEIAMIGIFGGILILMVIYGDYIWASLPFTAHTNETTIPLDCIHEISADNGAGNHTSNPHLIIKYEKEGEKKRVMNFAWEKNMKKVERRLSE
jgi:hypothetical protein